MTTVEHNTRAVIVGVQDMQDCPDLAGLEYGVVVVVGQ